MNDFKKNKNVNHGEGKFEKSAGQKGPGQSGQSKGQLGEGNQNGSSYGQGKQGQSKTGKQASQGKGSLNEHYDRYSQNESIQEVEEDYE